ncbi:MAG: biopolymer transporter ExbD, partial [Prevotellaceae bacterium]|nr:biopolymer transporter ExbD [Prevotellaceae bacterium]
LLLFFLIISTMVTPAAIKVLLPKASTSEPVVAKKNINVVITPELTYFVDEKQVSFDGIEYELNNAVQQAKARGEEISVLLQADKSLNLQHVVDVINIGNKLQVKMILFTQKE